MRHSPRHSTGSAPLDLFEVLNDNITEFVWLLSKDLTSIYMSPSVRGLLDISHDEAMGLGMQQLLSSRSYAAARVAFGEAFSVEATWPPYYSRDLELEFVHRDGRHVWTETTLRLIRDEHDKPNAILGVSRDITERKKAAEEASRFLSRLQQTQKLESLGLLAGGIAHDFNNLLSGILGCTEVVQQDMEASDPSHEALESVRLAAIEASALCRQLLAYSGRRPLRTSSVNMSTVIGDMKPLLEVAASREIDLRLDLDTGLHPVDAEISQLRQVLLNLVINAAEAIGDVHGTITVSAQMVECEGEPLAHNRTDDPVASGTYVAVEVTDTGCGMDDEVRKKLFEPFFTTKESGHGLGLAAALGIVRSHRGSLRVYSEPGRGTTFELLLPAAATKRETRKAPARNTRKRWRATGMVLLVDDEQSVRSAGRRILERLGLDVLLAEDGRAGVEIFRRYADQIALVILDMTMPGLNGPEAFRELRRIRSDVRVLLTSGYREEDTLERFREEGLAGFIPKPFQVATVSEKVRAALEGTSRGAAGSGEVVHIDDGTVSRKLAPCPDTERATIRPPALSTAEWTENKPRPRPTSRRGLVVKNGSNSL